MNYYLILLEVVCFLGVITAGTGQENNFYVLLRDNIRSTDDEALCNTTIKYAVESEKEYTYTYMEPYSGWCFSLSLRCTKYRNKARTEVKKIIEYKNKTVVECCEGYQNVSGRCMPICQDGCVHGQCATPNNCFCYSGWRGSNCLEECEEGSFGKGCIKTCLCKNGATCDKIYGKCTCVRGFTGEYCETNCSMQSMGMNCENLCKCENGGICNTTNKSCQCLAGYFGKLCNHKCMRGSFGDDCKNICKCKLINTEICNHINGECLCKSGWRGDYCEKVCEDKTWGPSCKKQCECGHNGSCHRVTGECSCAPGWHGSMCEKKCPIGYFEKDCKMKCPECLHKPGTCHHETGWCNCPDGSTGPSCDLECPKGKYGKNCEYLCLCSNNSVCEPVTGECLCLPGWIGDECQFPCPEGRYGGNCNFTCNCSNRISCNRFDGNCNCDETDDDPQCLIGPLIQSIEDNAALPVIMILVFVVLGVLLFMIMLVKIIFKRRKHSRGKILEDDSPSIANNGDFSDSDGKKFSNPVYDEMSDCIRNPTKSVAENKLFKDSRNDENYFEVDFSIPDSNDAKVLSDADEKNPKNESLGSKETDTNDRRISIDSFSVKYSNTVRNSADFEKDSSLYADVDLKEEHHYEFPTVIHRSIQ